MLLRNVNLVPMMEEKVVTDQAVRVEGIRIVDVGDSQDLTPRNREPVIDGQGAYLMPGLADMHMHTRQEWLTDRWPVSPFSLYLANGVTTIRDSGPIGEAPEYVLQWRDQIRDGALSGPALYSAGPPLFGPVDDAAAAVREQKAQGFDFVKLYSYLSEDEFQQAMEAARQVGMYVAGHIPFAVGLDGVLAEGMDEIAHLEELDFELIDFDRQANLETEEWFGYIMGEAARQYQLHLGIDADKLISRLADAIPPVVEMLTRTRTPVCTTMVVGQTIVQKLFEPKSFLARPENQYLPAQYLEAFCAGVEKHQRQFSGHEGLALFKAELERALLTVLHRAGVPLILGTDAGTGSLGLVPGFAIHDELRILTENGLTPYEAIAAGTVNACVVIQEMTGEGDFGTVEVGKRADLIVVRENPLDDVGHIRHIAGVMAAGRWYSQEALESMIALGA